MRALLISDTHGIFNAIYSKHKDSILDFDIIFLLGDHSTTDVKIIESISNGIPICRIAGNHDTLGETQSYESFTIDLHGHLFCPETEKPTFTGWQGSHRYKNSQDYGYTQKESLEEFKKIPKADILFSHDGPFNDYKDDAHCGLKGITQYIKHNKPKTLIFGHLHKPNHFKLDDTDCYCTYQLAWFEFDDEGNVINYKQYEVI